MSPHVCCCVMVCFLIYSPLCIPVLTTPPPCHKDMNHIERERSGIPSTRPRARPIPNPSATVFVSNVSEPCVLYFIHLFCISSWNTLYHGKKSRMFSKWLVIKPCPYSSLLSTYGKYLNKVASGISECQRRVKAGTEAMQLCSSSHHRKPTMQ